jgi:hypothetical protein
MAALIAPCDIRHVGDVLIVFRRPASGAGKPRHASPSDRETSPAETSSRHQNANPATAGRSTMSGPGGEVRLLRLRRKVLSRGT